jgi:hypothetical protein
MSDGGKGSAPRPFSVSDEVFAKNFEAIFGKKNDKPKNPTESGENEQLPRDDEESGGVEQ